MRTLFGQDESKGMHYNNDTKVIYCRIAIYCSHIHNSCRCDRLDSVVTHTYIHYSRRCDILASVDTHTYIIVVDVIY